MNQLDVLDIVEKSQRPRRTHLLEMTVTHLKHRAWHEEKAGFVALGQQYREQAEAIELALKLCKEVWKQSTGVPAEAMAGDATLQTNIQASPALFSDELDGSGGSPGGGTQE